MTFLVLTENIYTRLCSLYLIICSLNCFWTVFMYLYFIASQVYTIRKLIWRIEVIYVARWWIFLWANTTEMQRILFLHLNPHFIYLNYETRTLLRYHIQDQDPPPQVFLLRWSSLTIWHVIKINSSFFFFRF